MVMVSTLPDIFWNLLAQGRPGWWLFYAKMGLTLTLTIVAIFWKSLRPLRHFFLVMFAFFGLAELRSHIDFSLPILQSLLGDSVFDVRMQGEQTGKLAGSIAIIVLLFILGYKRREFFLARGNLRAPMEPVPLLGFPKPDPWLWFGLQWGLYIAGALAIMQYLGLRPSGVVMLKVMPMLPSILFYAALNAFNEEITFRVPMLATLEPVGGSRQALWMSAYYFGIAHYYGTPGGIMGGIASIFMGWILGKAMVETRGLFWAWWIHFLSDIAIFTFIAAALVK
jgi:hypothetical protein